MKHVEKCDIKISNINFHSFFGLQISIQFAKNIKICINENLICEIKIKFIFDKLKICLNEKMNLQ